MDLPLTLAIHPYDHVRGLTPQGIDLSVLELPIEEIFFRFTKFQEWHASEMSFGKTVSLMARPAESSAARMSSARLTNGSSNADATGGDERSVRLH